MKTLQEKHDKAVYKYNAISSIEVTLMELLKADDNDADTQMLFAMILQARQLANNIFERDDYQMEVAQ